MEDASRAEERSNTESFLGKKKVFPLLMKMAIPTVLSMFIQSMYNVVDSFFVARLSEGALNAVSLAFPLQNLVLAVSVGAGVGIGARISRALGEKKREEANSYVTHGAILTAIHALLFVLVGIFLSGPFLSMYTDDPLILQQGKAYAMIVVSCAVFSLVYIYIEKLLQAVGNTLFPMFMQGVGAIVNILLDPLFIYGIWIFPEMGVAGAALATVIGQICSCVLALVFIFWKSGGLKIERKGFRFSWKKVGAIYSVGIPSAMMIAMPSVLISVMNAILGNVSEIAVNFYGIYYKLQTIVYVPASGLVQGMRPIVAYNHGAKYYRRVDETVLWSVVFVGSIIALGTLLFELFPSQILSLFDTTGALVEIGVPALRIIAAGFILSTLGVILPGAFEALGMGIHSLSVTLIRQLILIPVLSLAFMPSLGLTGVWLSYPIAETVAAAVSLVFYLGYRKKRLKVGLAEENGSAIRDLK